MQSVRFWLKAFIPDSACERFGDLFGLRVPLGGPIFAGDQREFSDDPDASSRAHSEVTLGGLDTDAPFVATEVQRCGETRQIDEGGAIIQRATASTSGMKFVNPRGSQTVDPEGGIVDGPPNSVQIDFVGTAGNPLFGGPTIDYSGTLVVDRDGQRVAVSGATNGFPSYELYCSVDGGDTLTLLQKLPASPIDLIGEEDRPFSGSVVL